MTAGALALITGAGDDDGTTGGTMGGMTMVRSVVARVSGACGFLARGAVAVVAAGLDAAVRVALAAWGATAPFGEFEEGLPDAVLVATSGDAAEAVTDDDVVAPAALAGAAFAGAVFDGATAGAAAAAGVGAGVPALSGTAASTGSGIGLEPGTAVAALALPTMAALLSAGREGASSLPHPLTSSMERSSDAVIHPRVHARLSTGGVSRS
jgi:hypothetical protein